MTFDEIKKHDGKIVELHYFYHGARKILRGQLRLQGAKKKMLCMYAGEFCYFRARLIFKTELLSVIKIRVMNERDIEFREVNYKKNPVKNLIRERKGFEWSYDVPHGENIENFFIKYPELIGVCFPLACYLRHDPEVTTEVLIMNYVRPLNTYRTDLIKFALIECSCSLI